MAHFYCSGFILSTLAQIVSPIMMEMATCHADLEMKITKGLVKQQTIPWMGFVQYDHLATNQPHHTLAPRITLVHKQFGLGTAMDLMHPPRNYKLSKAIFGDYIQDETECKLTKSQVQMGLKCPPAYYEIPITDVVPHPEYSSFGVGNSLAVVKLMRPLKSHYMIPICMPTMVERKKQKRIKTVHIVDYLSAVPKYFERESSSAIATKPFKLYTHNECRKHRLLSNLGSAGVTHVLCTSGCGVRPGSPIVIHTKTGIFELIGVAAGSSPCLRSKMRRRLNPEPPIYIDVFPYVNWIANVVSASVMPMPYPVHYRLTGDETQSITVKRRPQKCGWLGRVYAAGNLCYKRLRDVSLFYYEAFSVIDTRKTTRVKLNVFLKVHAGVESKIMCARLQLPNRLASPIIRGVGGYNISLEFGSEWFPKDYTYSLSLVARNSTAEEFVSWLPERAPGYW